MNAIDIERYIHRARSVRNTFAWLVQCSQWSTELLLYRVCHAAFVSAFHSWATFQILFVFVRLTIVSDWFYWLSVPSVYESIRIQHFIGFDRKLFYQTIYRAREICRYIYTYKGIESHGINGLVRLFSFTLSTINLLFCNRFDTIFSQPEENVFANTMLTNRWLTVP